VEAIAAHGLHCVGGQRGVGGGTPDRFPDEAFALIEDEVAVAAPAGGDIVSGVGIGVLGEKEAGGHFAEDIVIEGLLSLEGGISEGDGDGVLAGFGKIFLRVKNLRRWMRGIRVHGG